MAQTPTKENDSDVASGNVRINACCVCSMDVNMSSQANLRLPFLQNCFHISLLSVGSSCVSQTVGQQGVGTCMRHTSRHTSLYFYLCEDFYRHNASISHHFPKMRVDWVLMLLSVCSKYNNTHTHTHTGWKTKPSSAFFLLSEYLCRGEWEVSPRRSIRWILGWEVTKVRGHWV